MSNKPFEEYTKEDMIEKLRKINEKLGRVPSRKDLPEEMKPYIKKLFGKWCYALEESGLSKPSERTLERRRRRKEKWNKIHRHRREMGKAAKRPETGCSDK